VAYARSIPQLSEDLSIIRPTVLISVPRIYERVYAAIKTKLGEGPALARKLFELTVEIGWARFEHSQKRGPYKLSFVLWPILNRLVAAKVLDRLGGRLRAAVSGGAALPYDVGRVFLGLGLPVLQGYGMTETSPVVRRKTFADNMPASIGHPIAGTQIKIADNGGLLVKGPNVMQGYWGLPDATKAMFTEDGWLNTGDTASLEERRLYITRPLTEI